jgi:replicative DNA helicase
MGKTLFCQALTTNVAIDQGKNVMFFSMEMSARSLYERFISALSRVPPHKLKKAIFSNEDYGRITQAVQTLEASGLYFTEEANLSLGQIKSKVRAQKNKLNSVDMIIIDYLGLMQTEKAERHDIAIGNITRGLKELAKEVKAPIVLIAQANRANTRPNMRNLKDSSCIEADADVVMFVHRQEVLEPDTELKGLTEIIIAKDRHNDGNGTIYMEKVNGGFVELSQEQAAHIVHNEEMRASEAKSQKRGYQKA